MKDKFTLVQTVAICFNYEVFNFQIDEIINQRVLTLLVCYLFIHNKLNEITLCLAPIRVAWHIIHGTLLEFHCSASKIRI